MNAPFPEWIRLKWASGEAFSATREMMQNLQLHTVCQSARCPNQGECWERRTATFMILGSRCTRNCGFCSVSCGTPEPLDAEEPTRVAEAVRQLSLKHAVVTSVTRDDLPDGGALQFARTIEAIRELTPGTTVEVLVPDFQGDRDSIRTAVEAEPEVFGHNIETVRRLYPTLRGAAHAYERALAVLQGASALASETTWVKSALMLGHGETPGEIEATLCDLLDAGCKVVYMGQYLRPTSAQRPVANFIRPEQFEAYEKMAYNLGFAFAVAGPLVRSSYRSEELVEHRTSCDTRKGLA
jgi:lipoic acid synthetase